MSDLSKKSRSSKQISLSLKVSLCVAIGLYALVFLLFRVDSKILPDREASKPFVTFVSDKSFEKDVELEEYAILFDSAPLFIPTRWNAAQQVEVSFENVPLEPFSQFEPKIEPVKELRPDELLITDAYSVKKPTDLLAFRFWRFFEGFGRSFKTISAFETASPVAKVSVIGEPQKPAISLAVDLESASFSIPRPVNYTIHRSNEGLIWSIPNLVETSGNDAFDQAVARWLQRPDVLAKLPIGYLSVQVFFW